MRGVLTILVGLVLAAGPGPQAQAADQPGYLIVPFIDLAHKQQDAFLRSAVPELTLHGKLINAGTAADPWYCIEYADMDKAKQGKVVLDEMFRMLGLPPIGETDSSCAAG